MSFGFGIGDFIAGANLAHKLIRVMTETRGASLEYQEALAELCSIQQVFIQVTQLSRNEILPKATLNSLAQIIMPSMTTIADFLNKTKHYQIKLSPGGGLSSSWSKMGWALFRKDELKLLRDTLHLRLSAINTLLAAANHLSSASIQPLPDTVAQFHITDEYAEKCTEQDTEDNMTTLAGDHDGERGMEFAAPPPALAQPQEIEQRQEQDQPSQSHQSISEICDNVTSRYASEQKEPVVSNSRCREIEKTIGEMSPSLVMNIEARTKDVPPAVGFSKKLQSVSSRSVRPQIIQKRSPIPATQPNSARPQVPIQPNKDTKVPHEGHKRIEAYLQDLFETAMTIQADAEAKAKAAQRAAEEEEWRQRVEENIKLKAEADLRAKIEREQKLAEELRQADEERKKAEQAMMEKLMEEAEKALKGREQAPVRFKDAVGRKFSFPYHECQTWQAIEELINQAFLHVDVIGPHVRAGHYDLIGPNGEIILPQVWEKVIEPGWAVTMHMWPMDKPEPIPAMPPGPALGGRGIGGRPLLGGPRPPGARAPQGQPGPIRPPGIGTARGPPPHIIPISRNHSLERKKSKSSLASALTSKFKRLRRRRSSISSTSSSGSNSYYEPFRLSD
ncbi:hypothetical protein F5Y15DRAFT_278667 [Xylariaceae sp. FL0016]|nr:hypothetical protein F5Y15DRAFT_278667 [Xylariaceae sp. FL0016]